MPTARRLSSHRGWVVDWLSFLIQVVLIFHDVQTSQSVGEGSKAIDLLGMQAVTLPVGVLLNRLFLASSGQMFSSQNNVPPEASHHQGSPILPKPP